MRLLFAALLLCPPALISAAPAIPFAAAGTGAARASGGGVIVSSWLGMGLQGPTATAPGVRAGSGLPGALVATPVAAGPTHQLVADRILGLLPLRRVSLHQRGRLDANADGLISAPDLVRAGNRP